MDNLLLSQVGHIACFFKSNDGRMQTERLSIDSIVISYDFNIDFMLFLV